jgi:hypothetical protein
MLAIVKSAASMRGPLLYNEHKVEQKQAIFLDAHNFLLDKQELTIKKEMETFQSLTRLNERSKQKVIHISLNFAESDHLDERQLIRVADDFMRGIDFGDQPWLLYQHVDAGHPHLHIVSTNIRPDGTRISNDLRSPYRLKQLCYHIEEKHHLTPAIPMPDIFGVEDPHKQKQQHDGSMAVYGKKPTKTQLEGILAEVNQKFHFTSFESYNAILSLYNVRADRGRENSPMYLKKGLYYRMIDKEGRKVGAPIKGSAFHGPFTLQKLEQKFIRSQEQVLAMHNILKVRIDWPLWHKKHDYCLQSLVDDLRKEKIRMVIPALTQRPTRQKKPVHHPNKKPDDGHGIFYVDFNYRTVTRDTDLGSPYSAASILQRTGVEREILLLHEQGKLQCLRRSDREALNPDYPDAAEKRRVLFKLSLQHDELVQKKLELKQQQTQKLRQVPRMRRSL